MFQSLKVGKVSREKQRSHMVYDIPLPPSDLKQDQTNSGDSQIPDVLRQHRLIHTSVKEKRLATSGVLLSPRVSFSCKEVGVFEWLKVCHCLHSVKIL